jgi:hypothetical protein
MGHASTRAALIYQHRTTHRDKLIADDLGNTALAARSQVERMTGIEPALSAWEADVLPLNYIRRLRRCPL